MPADRGLQALLERESGAAGFRKARRDEDDGRNVRGGTVVDDGEYERRWDGNDCKIDRAWCSRHRWERLKSGYFCRVWNQSEPDRQAASVALEVDTRGLDASAGRQGRWTGPEVACDEGTSDSARIE